MPTLSRPDTLVRCGLPSPKPLYERGAAREARGLRSHSPSEINRSQVSPLQVVRNHLRRQVLLECHSGVLKTLRHPPPPPHPTPPPSPLPGPHPLCVLCVRLTTCGGWVGGGRFGESGGWGDHPNVRPYKPPFRASPGQPPPHFPVTKPGAVESLGQGGVTPKFYPKALTLCSVWTISASFSLGGSG